MNQPAAVTTVAGCQLHEQAHPRTHAFGLLLIGLGGLLRPLLIDLPGIWSDYCWAASRRDEPVRIDTRLGGFGARNCGQIADLNPPDSAMHFARSFLA